MTKQTETALPEEGERERTDGPVPEPPSREDSREDGEELELLPESEDARAAQPKPEPPDRVRRLPIALASLLLALLLLGGAAGGLLTARILGEIRPVSVGIGEVPVFPVLGDGFLGRFVEADPPLGEIDTSGIGERQAGITLYGFLRRLVTVTVQDRIPPEFEPCAFTVAPGISPEPEDFVLSRQDQTELTFSYADAPDFDTPGRRTVILAALDEGGNRTEREASLTVVDETVRWELGKGSDGLEDAVRDFYPGLRTVDLSACDAGKPGLYPVEGEGEGARYRVRLLVEDTTPPTADPVSRDILMGTAPEAAEFVSGVRDASSVTVTYAEDPDFDTPGDGEVRLLLTDAAGNRTECAAAVTVWDLPGWQMIEFGATPEEILAGVFTSSLPTDGLTVVKGFDSSLAETGLHTLTLRGAYSEFTVQVEMEDTKPPTAEVRNLDLLLGETAPLEAFVTDVRDYSGASVSYAAGPDFEKTGEQTLEVLLEDSVGNRTTVFPILRIWDVPAALTVESGTGAETVREAFFRAYDGPDPLILEGAEDAGSWQPGTYPVLLRGEFSEMDAEITVEDTTPPSLTPKPFTVYKGETPGPWDLVAKTEDRAPVTVTFASAPDTSAEGNIKVVLKASDPYGNESLTDAVLTVIADHDPPVIYGAADQKVVIGGTVSFRKNVWAEDARDGGVNVTVDSSAVNLSAVGVYPVTYSAADSSGNVGTAVVTVTVTDYDEDAVAGYADAVLARILPWNGTQREKAQAIFDWVSSSIRYSTATSYLMGQYWRAAYSGFTGYSGNCYTYYAVSAVLLSRAGIDNLMISRNDPNRPHYWNLVSIDGNWYHFDTCPHYAGHEIYSFLLTDAEVAAYSANQVAGYYSFDAELYPATP